MATLTKGKTFTNGELVTPEKIHQLVDSATVANITNADLDANAAIADTKLAQISTAGKVANTATSATSANTANAIVARDSSGNFSAATITASLTGNVTGNAATATTATTATNALACSGNAATATKLATARTINGVAFDGTANITLATGVTSTVAISQGGTGATTASDARTNLGAAASSHTHSVATTTVDGFMSSSDKSKLDGIPAGGGGGITGTVAISQGGTGSTTAAGALTNLGAAASSHNHDASAITSGTIANARTTATTATTANSIVQRGASGEITFGNLTSLPNSFNYGDFWSTDLNNYSILGRGNIQIANNGAVGTQLVMFFGGGTTLGTISRSGTSSVAYATSSDYRLKTNLEPLTGAMARLAQIPVHRFNWLADSQGQKVDGFLAHEAGAIVPECVVGTKDAVDAGGKPIYQGIDQSKLVPLLVAAVQELAARVEALEAK
jgi:hypothetical protein